MSEDDEPIVINAGKFLRPGHQPKIDQPEDLLDEAFNYFLDCERCRQRPTVTGLSLWLGYSGREGLEKASEARDGYLGDAIKKAKSVIAMWREGQLGCGKDAGHIFVLKNMGWRDEQQRTVDATVNAKVKITSIKERMQEWLEAEGLDSDCEQD